jgi:hypothetical protein
VISASGYAVSTLTVFAGPRPTTTNALDCVNREGAGSLQMRVQAKAHKQLWIRIGTDRPADDSQATLLVQPGDKALVIDGGPGGSDPTAGGPGGGYPTTCFRRPLAKARIAGPGFTGAVKAANRRPNVVVALTVRRGPVCDVQLQLYGPKGQVYASAQAISLDGRRLVRLPRVRKLVRGGYRLKVTALSELGSRVSVTTGLRGRLS